MWSFITGLLLVANVFFAAWGWSTGHYFTATINSFAAVFMTVMMFKGGDR